MHGSVVECNHIDEHKRILNLWNENEDTEISKSWKGPASVGTIRYNAIRYNCNINNVVVDMNPFLYAFSIYQNHHNQLVLG